MATIDENNGQGAKAVQEYQQYILNAGPQGAYQAAAKARLQALNKNPSDTQKLQTSGDLKTAKDASDAYDAGVKAQQSNQYDQAIELYQKAAQLNPKEPAYQYAIGTAYQAKSDMDNALASYQKALAIQPNNKQYQDIVAQAKAALVAPIMDQAVKLQTGGDPNGAVPLYEKALAMMPTNARGYTNLGSAYQQAEKWSNAKDAYQQAFKIDPKGEVDNLYYMGILDENAGKAPDAIGDYQRYVSLAPRGQWAAQAQARISALRANPANVQKIATQAETQKSAAAQTAYEAGIKLQTDNKLDEAIASYNQAITIAKDPAYIYALATAWQAKGDIDKALENYKLAAA